jgi:hypothetical protein
MLRRLVILLAVLLVLAGGALAGFWFYGRGLVADGIAGWQRDWRALGGTADFAPPPVEGFPLRLSARFIAPTLALPSGETWRGPPSVDAWAWLWSFRTVHFEAPGHHELELPAGHLALDAEALGGSIAFGDLGPERLSLEVAQATLANRELGRSLHVDALTLSAGPLVPLDGRDYAIAFDGDLKGFPLPDGDALGAQLLAPTIQHLHLAGTLKGPLALEADPRAAAARWRDGGGVLELGRVELAWGDLALKGSGSLTLDEAFRPKGKLMFESAGLLALVERMDRAGLIDPEVAPALKTALKALAAGQDKTGRDLVTLPVTAQDGVLSLGIVPLGRLLPLF